ncbi:MAG TPA: TerC family protein [Polyangiales bacterium]
MSLIPWIGFVALVVFLLAFDLGVLNKKPHVVKPTEALGWTVLWVTLSLGFNACIYLMYEHHFLGIGQTIGHSMSGKHAAMQFFTAYVVEESLSIDNLFVMALIFNYFAVPAQYQHRVLFLGILGALVFRGLFIGLGLAFINLFTWAVYVFGALLLYTAGKMLVAKEDSLEPDKHPLVRTVRRYYPMTADYHADRFFVHLDGKHMATPLCVALVLIESSDVVFAADSVPAVFGVTHDPFIAFTSNVFAILGLRSLYFALAAALHAFRYMKVSLVFVLAFVGVKMMLTHLHPIDTITSLLVIGSLLGVGVVASTGAGVSQRLSRVTGNSQRPAAAPSDTAPKPGDGGPAARS